MWLFLVCVLSLLHFLVFFVPFWYLHTCTLYAPSSDVNPSQEALHKYSVSLGREVAQVTNEKIFLAHSFFFIMEGFDFSIFYHYCIGQIEI